MKSLPTKIKKLLEPCKFFSKEQKLNMKGIVEYAVWCHERIKHLEAEIRSLKQPDMFAPPDDKYDGGSSTLKPLEAVEYDVRAHCKLLLETHGLDSNVVRGFVARKGWDTAKFVEMAKNVDTNGVSQ
jgi:hypothetical protein